MNKLTISVMTDIKRWIQLLVLIYVESTVNLPETKRLVLFLIIVEYCKVNPKDLKLCD